MEEKIEAIKEVIHKLRPYLQRDGGDLEFVDFKDGIVYVHMLGACAGCMMLDSTIKDGVEQILVEEVPGVILLLRTTQMRIVLKWWQPLYRRCLDQASIT